MWKDICAGVVGVAGAVGTMMYLVGVLSGVLADVWRSWTWAISCSC